MNNGFRLPVLVASAVAFLAFCASAGAQTTIGQLAPLNPPSICSSGPTDAFQSSLSGGTSYVVPAPGGAITSWSTNAGAGAGQTLKMKVLSPVSGSMYSVLAHDGPRALTPSVLNTFPVSIPVKAGDIIGLDDQNADTVHNACIFTASAGDIFGAGSVEDAADGATEEIKPILPGYKVNLSATMLPPPVITSVTPGTGPTAGAVLVAIVGANFVEVKSVDFGSVPASSFTVNSEGQITAAAPPATAGPVTVSVTTIAGTVTSAQQFTYSAPPTACIVPKLNGKTLKAAKKKLKAGDCRLGTVKKLGGDMTKFGKVAKQNPKPGKMLPVGSKVSVKISG